MTSDAAETVPKVPRKYSPTVVGPIDIGPIFVATVIKIVAPPQTAANPRISNRFEGTKVTATAANSNAGPSSSIGFMGTLAPPAQRSSLARFERALAR